MDLKKVLEKVGKVLDSGRRGEVRWFDVDTETMDKEDYEELEARFAEEGTHTRVLNAGVALNKETGREVQRIWLVAFPTKKELKEWEKGWEERKKRDHRHIGEQLDWFHVQEDLIGPGLPLLHPKGMTIKRELEKLMREVNEWLGAEEVFTPHIAKADLWKLSGHYDHYRDKMFVWEQEGEEWGIKAMNCPMHIQIYRFKPRSYRDLPVRYAEFGVDYRKEQSGELHGLSRVWAFTQDDHHFFVRPDQIEDEVRRIIQAVEYTYGVFGFDYKLKLATRPEDSMGTDEFWELAEGSLRGALEKQGIDYDVKEGDGAFYAPKIDLYMTDSMGREWQLGTIQVDFFMPENFKLSYVDEDGEHQRPLMIHFAIYGSFERFMSVLIEHYAGRLPLWLAPDQVRVLPVGEDQEDYAHGVAEELRDELVRAGVATEGTLGKRIRDAETDKVAVIAVVGDREVEAGTVSVRGGDTLDRNDFRDRLVEAIVKRQESL